MDGVLKSIRMRSICIVIEVVDIRCF